MSMDSTTGNGEDDRVLVAEYALDLLEGGERAALARRIAAEPTLKAELGLWRHRLASLDEQFTPETAPARTWGSIERRLFGDAQPSGKGLLSWWSSVTALRGMMVAGYLIAAGAVGYIALQPPRLDPQALANQLVAAMSAEDSSVSFVALYSPETGMLRLTALSGEAVPDRDFELWAIQGDNAPVSMGLVAMGDRQEMPLPSDLPSSFAAGTVLAVSLEPKGGSPEPGPTGPIVAMGKATPI
jgi:anti-sigma-K factor RskA